MSDAYVDDELSRCYDLLGVSRGASSQELKTAHRDMAKVWHPDRFTHDPRLQQKAQEKLKEINEAYDLLTSGKSVRRARHHASSNRPDAARPAASTRRFRWQLILLPGLVSVVVFFAAFRVLISSASQSAQTSVEQAGQTQTISDEDRSQPEQVANASARSRKRDDARSSVEAKSDGQTNIETDAQPQSRTPLPTVTLTIDPTTGMIATPDCPTKSRMTYPSGSEPTNYCTASHKNAETTAQEEGQARSKGSRFKSFARRLASPARLLKGKGSEGEN